MYKNLKTIEGVDILVVGAGSAGCVAALAAASPKYRVLLVERYGFLGGSSTQMLDTFYGFFTPGEVPKKIIGGLPDVVVNTLNVCGEIFLRPNTYGAGTGVNYNPERLKNVWDTLLLKAGVDFLLHTTLIDVNPLPDGRYECIFWNKSGFWKVSPQRIIDASGDADFCHLAGFDYEVAGEQEPAQSMTTTFRMANVDLDAFEKAGGKKALAQIMATTSHPLPRKEGSATHDAHASCRSMAQTMAMGQAAGLAALQSLDRDSSASQLEVSNLREKLLQQGAILETPHQAAFTGKDQWKLNFA